MLGEILLEDLIETKVFDVAIVNTDAGNVPVVFLIDQEDRILPIFIDEQQAFSIKAGIEGNMQVPLTHDLMMDVFRELDVKVLGAKIYDLIENRYCAKVSLNVKGEVKDFECRSSDAIALAVRSQSPIYAANKIMNEMSIMKKDLLEGKSE
ncbi:MAG: bifunctional nuclease family protein [Nitrososphaeria archaeon]|nr:bifunctional nuclease family protein [Nitrososphaeria archaeon]